MPSFKKLFAARDMTEGPPWKNLLIFTGPMLIGNIIQQLYSTVDAVVVGQYVGDGALAAVGSTMSIFNLLMVFFIGISSGASIMVSQYFGGKRREELSNTIGVCITVLTLTSLVLMIFAPLGTRPLLRMLNTPEGDILRWAADYINILLWGALGMAYYNILTGILRGLGDSFSPLLYLAITCLLNVALDLLFVAVFHWEVAGAAFATVIAQFVSGILCLRKLMKMRGIFDFGLRFLKPSKRYVVQMVRLGLPTGASQAVFSLAMVLVQRLTNSFGAAFMACNIIVMRIDGFVMMPNFSFSNAITVFAGQNMGAGKIDRVKLGARQCLFMAVGTAAVIVTLMLLLGSTVAGMFTDSDEIIRMSVQMLTILAPGYVIFAFGQVFWGVVRGAGDTMSPMWVSVITVILIRVPSAYLLVWLMKTPDSLFWALLIMWAINSTLGYIVYRIGKWRHMGLVHAAP